MPTRSVTRSSLSSQRSLLNNTLSALHRHSSSAGGTFLARRAKHTYIQIGGSNEIDRPYETHSRKGKTRQHRTLLTGSNKTKDRPHSLVGHQKDAACSRAPPCQIKEGSNLAAKTLEFIIYNEPAKPPLFFILIFLPRFLLFILFFKEKSERT